MTRRDSLQSFVRSSQVNITEFPDRPTRAPRKRYRSVWISDLHLGTRGCRSDPLLDFLEGMETETLYLVGDIVDLWALRSRFFWPKSHDAVVISILEHARRGTKVLYIPGNHDEALRMHVGSRFGGVTVVSDAVHETADGRQFLVVHGDVFDIVSCHADWLSHLGAQADAALLVVNHWLNRGRQRVGLPYWSLSAYLKGRMTRAVNLLGNYEAALVDEARRRHVDGIICGHIHRAEIRHIGDILYGNSGDWVESCTALVEHHGGRMEVLHCATTDHHQPVRVAVRSAGAVAAARRSAAILRALNGGRQSRFS